MDGRDQLKQTCVRLSEYISPFWVSKVDEQPLMLIFLRLACTVIIAR